MKTTSTIALTLALGMTLSGCQGLFGPRSAHVQDTEDARVAMQEQALHPALDQGRQLLQAGRTAQAIELLRVAQRDPASMADASNGLGVAYAKLGRHDLADRYFRMAMALKPEDARFAANMLRLQRDHKLAVRRNEEAERLAQRAEEERLAAQAARDAVPGRIERLSRGQVSIRTQALPQMAAPKMEVLAMRSSATKAPTPAEPEQSDEAPVAEEAKGYPLTIDFTRTPSGKSIAPAKREYPVRVYIGA